MAEQNFEEIEKLVDSLLPKETIIKIGTKNDKKCGDTPRKNLFIAHPTEGHVRDLETLANLIDMDVYGLQSTKDTPMDSFVTMAGFYLEKIKSVQPTGPYFIGGYSLGVSIGMEIVLQIEKEEDGASHVETFLCLDCSPSYVHFLLNLIIGTTNFYMTPFRKVQDEILLNFLSKFPTVTLSKDDRQKLVDSRSWEGKLERVVYLIDPSGQMLPNLREDLKAAAVVFYKNRVTAFKYHPGDKVKAKVMLVKSSGLRSHYLGDDYELQEHCDHPIQVHQVAGDHLSFIQGDAASQVAQHVNTFLSS